MRQWFSIAAMALAAIATIVSFVDNDPEPLGFFAVATVASGIQAWCVSARSVSEFRRLAMGIALAWIVGAIWIGALLIMYQTSSRTPPVPEVAYLGLTATAIHLIALYGGAVAVTIAAFGPSRWLDR